jgi:hypothetical protein
MDIEVENDGKGNYQSFTASIDLNLPYLFNSKIEMYGATENEAVQNLYNAISELKKDVNNKFESLANKDG